MRNSLPNATSRLRHLVKKLWRRVRFGVITETVVSTSGDGVTAEVEYRGRGGRLIGYWAYGSFDPSWPYRG